jgi:hypothetical protein
MKKYQGILQKDARAQFQNLTMSSVKIFTRFDRVGEISGEIEKV